MTIRAEMLRAKAREIRPELAKAREVAGKAAAEGRNMTAAERAAYDAAMAKARPILDALDAQRHDEAVMAQAQELATAVGGPVGTASTGVKNGQRLSFKGIAPALATRMLSGDVGAKSLAPSGAAIAPQAFTQDPVALGRVATGLLDVLPTQVQTSSEYAYLAQVTRTNNAAVVEDGDLKPTSVIGLTRVEQSLSVVATLSEPVQRFWLIDAQGALETFIDNELRFNLGVAVEQKVLDDINGTSGIQLQEFSSSALQTIRKSITKLEVAGHSAAAVVLHPADWEGIELALSSTNAVEHLSLPYDPATRRLFGVPVAATTSQAAGVGHVIAQGAVVVDTDSTGVGVQWSENVGDSFAYNKIVARCEGRFGTSVLAALGVVVATLVAGD